MVEITYTFRLVSKWHHSGTLDVTITTLGQEDQSNWPWEQTAGFWTWPVGKLCVTPPELSIVRNRRDEAFLILAVLWEMHLNSKSQQAGLVREHRNLLNSAIRPECVKSSLATQSPCGLRKPARRLFLSLVDTLLFSSLIRIPGMIFFPFLLLSALLLLLIVNVNSVLVSCDTTLRDRGQLES